ncbi:transmembrane protein 120A-A isoform X3 [Sphaeramia orbicularis]|uniref:transmembrane protein 120A-A isoform X3 n=1 Tax=Sphaeramia orbicularis TaxID=375764 RepID=UPI00117DD3B6|nr:transmembrane protein 120A-like isoform X3 [Sphaeramia orbicularis]
MLSSPTGFAECLHEWEDLEKDYQQIQETHRLYKQKLEEVTRLQDSCSSAIARQRKKQRELTASLLECKEKHSTSKLSVEDMEAIDEIQNSINDRSSAFFEMEAFLPKKNGLYLSLVLGNVNVTLLNKQAKFAYKDEYEKFKLVLTVILFLFSFMCRLISYRALDALFNFLLVWYYCTLTIRESILISNGSRIKGWWVFHHYVSTFLSGVMLTWLRPVSAVLLSEWLFVQTASTGRKTQHGSNSRGFSVLDVERPVLSASFLILRSILAALQQHHTVQDVPVT